MKMKIMRIMLPLITLSVIGMIAVVLVGCLPEEPWDFPDAIIDGDWVYEKIEADDNEIDELIIMPEEPARDGYDFGGWYTESECINKFAATTKGENDINLFAKWMKIN